MGVDGERFRILLQCHYNPGMVSARNERAYDMKVRAVRDSEEDDVTAWAEFKKQM